jgi:bis(5'-nucleosidyl)-tetraphosphatase
MMIWEHSAGIIPFRTRAGKRRYLMLLSNLAKNEYWEFPKGLIEKGESAQEAAAREFFEEAGIEKWTPVAGFKKVLKYFYRRDQKLIGKTVTYFIGRVHSTKVKISSESKDYVWVTKQEAAQISTFKSILDLLEEADRFLAQQEKG